MQPGQTIERQPAIMTVDFGLTNCKVCLFSISGKILAQQATPYPTISPQTLWSEQEPDQWVRALQDCSKKLWQSVDPSVCSVQVISVTSHMHAVIAVDGNGRPLTNCLTLFDRRSEVEAQEINASVGEGYAYRVTGGRLESYTPAAKILWLKKNRPEVFQKAAMFLPAKDYLRTMLGGEPVTDPVDAAGMLLYDLLKGSWDATLVEAAGIRPDRLPEIRSSIAGAGRLNPFGAGVLGLKPGVPLIVGAGDDVETVGAGVAGPGRALEHIGTTGTFIACLDHPVFDSNQVVELYPHPVPGLFLLGGATNAAGLSLDWARRLLHASESGLKELPLTYPPAAGRGSLPLYLPFIHGERGLLWKADARGVFLHLREDHSREDLAQAVYEGVLFSMKEILVAVQAMGVHPSVILSGSSAGNSQWNQMRADAYGLPVVFPASENLTGLGAAILAMLHLGAYPDLPGAIQACCQERERVTPDPARLPYFESRFNDYSNSIRLSKAIL